MESRVIALRTLGRLVAWVSLLQVAVACVVVALGLGLGVPVAYASGRLRESRPLLVEGVGGVFLCVGLAEYLQVSCLLACVVMGCTVANLAHHHKGPFRVLQDIEWPFAILFELMGPVGARFALRHAGRSPETSP